MGQPTPHPPALLLLAAFSRHEAALQWAKDRAVAAWGPVARVSPAFDFDQTDYYTPTMGPGLKKVFWVFDEPFRVDTLPEVKLATNAWEDEYAQAAGHDEPRPLNLDPGYLTAAKLVLASTKNYSHRIYLARGIFAEITLFFRRGRWKWHEWTFPDYRRPEYHRFFSQAREPLLQRGKGDSA